MDETAEAESAAMKIERLELFNWMPFAGRQALELPAGPIAVTAVYKGNPRRSNWAGKTALLEAIEWCLFNVHRKRYEDDVIHGKENEVSVRIVLTGDVVVERSRRRGKATQLLVTIGGVGFKKKEAQKKITELLGFTGDDYRATICFAQGDTSAIVDRTSGERRKVVGQWLELEAWLRVTSRIRVKARDTTKAIQAARATLKALEGHVDEHGYLPDEEHTTGDAVADRAAAMEAVNARLAKVQGEIADLEKQLEDVSEMEIARLDRIRYDKLVDEAKELRDKIKAADPHALKVRLELATETASGLDAKLAVARSAYDDAASLKRDGFDGTCPVIRDACPAAEAVRENVDAAQKRYDDARETFTTASTAADEGRREKRAAETEERTLDRDRTRYKELVAEIKKLKPSAERFDAEAELEADKVQTLRNEIGVKKNAEREITREQVTLEARARRIVTTEEDIARVGEQIEELEKTAQINAVALRCVGPSGVPARIAEASLSQLEDRANALLVSSGLSFTFAWDRETRDLTPTCFECGYTYKGKKDKSCPACGAERGMKRADELEILVDDGSGEIEDVKAKSGGAKVLIGAAIRLGAGLMLRELRASPAAWAQVDEPFGPLDAENRATLAQTFAGMLGAVGLEQAFVVSHDSALLDALPSRLEIVREGSVSTVSMR